MTQKALTLSIVIPVYNEENYLKGCLEAIAAQTVMPNEVIIVNNNSTDKSLTIAKTYDFVKILNEPKQGIVYARNRGFNAATSDIIGRIDGDTILPTAWVRRVKEFYKSEVNNQQVVTGGGYFYNCRWPNLAFFAQHYLVFYLNRLILGYHMLWGSNMALTKVMWDKVKTDVCQGRDRHEDLDLGIHLRQHGYGISYRKKLKVGVVMKRIFENRQQLWPHLEQWPHTFRKHGFRLWWLSWLGVIFIYTCCQLLFIFEKLANFTRG